MVFDEQQRAHIREALIAAAETDVRITAAAVTGSVALGREDRWSDIDLAFRLSADAVETDVVADWTRRMYDDFDVVDHLDVFRASARFRVFLRADSLQIDLAFWATEPEFGTLPAFHLVYGDGGPHPARPDPDAAQVIGTGWLYALHARSSLARGRIWQAQHMLDGLREQVLVLACLRHHTNPVQGRGHDDLPAELLTDLQTTLATGLDPTRQRSAFDALVRALLTETAHVDPERAQRITPSLDLMRR
ncbi:hypothetical protein [Nocardia lijiangensis]|uniref:hypothetical protein n=1 Tax=Nocardia lijiangensis TaxID=299618 RepID=UPI003D71EFA1